MFNKIIPSVILLCVLFSCGDQEAENSADFAITSPKSGWTYSNDLPVLFAVNMDTDEVSWRSSIDGDLGTGNNLQKYITSGNHTITAEINGSKKAVLITINEKIYNTYDEIKILLNYFPLARQFPKGEYYPCLVSHEGSVNGFCMSQDNKKKYSGAVMNNQASDDKKILLLRDYRPKQYHPGIKSIVKRISMKVPVRFDIIGDRRTFRVINTLSGSDIPHLVQAELCYSSNDMNLWLPVGINIDNDLLQQCIEKIETLILPRVKIIWGEHADIDADGKIAVLMSQTINDEGVALGYFNSGDFFFYNDNPLSKDYNPFSNEMDIIYSAVPDLSEDSLYGPGPITATIGHELTHAVNFTNKTWKRMSNGSEIIPYEETFLDEGFSHLSENLLGCGISGGNIQFFKLYLDNTALYSFCRQNWLGKEDSAGMRGAMTLFMSWLFWKKGGLNWNKGNPVLIEDVGGISFLQKLVSSPAVGWESIGIAFGQPTDVLFEEMIYDLNKARMDQSPYNNKKDMYTGEPVDFFINMGDIILNDICVLNIGLPIIYQVDTEDTLNTLPWSFQLAEPIDFPGTAFLNFDAINFEGKSSINMIYKE